MFGAVSLGGAKQRLLPERIPALFFGTAVIAHIAAWAVLPAVASDLPRFGGGPGPALAAIHLLTLGVLVCTAMGASLQMLPVALGRPAPGERTCLVIFAAFGSGATLLIGGFAVLNSAAMIVAAFLLLCAVLLYAGTIARLLRGSAGALRRFLGTALASLVAAAILAASLVGNYELGYLPDHGRIASAHATLAAFGFMGMMALGFSHILIPMFAIAEPPPETALIRTYWLAATALVLVVTGLLIGSTMLSALGVVLGFGGAVQHIRSMADVLGRRMRKRLGPEFLLIRASWASLITSLMLAQALLLDLLPTRGSALFILIVLYGWLLSLLTGVLQRVLPFLASMHASRRQARPLPPTKLVAEQPLKFHLFGHFSGLATVVTGIAYPYPNLIVVGGILGAGGAISFAWFTASVLKRTRDHIKTGARRQP